MATINEKALEKTIKDEYLAAGISEASPVADLIRIEMRRIIETYLKNCEKIEAEEAAERERKKKIRQAERESGKDVGWFPGDCCD